MLFELLEKTVSEHQHETAIKFVNHKISYQDLFDLINKLANGLLDAGIKKGDRVAIFLPNTPHFIFAYYAIISIGGIVVTLNTISNDEELTVAFRDSAPKALIIWDKLLHRIRKVNSGAKITIVLGDKVPANSIALTNLMAKAKSHKAKTEIDPGDLAQIHFTAGIVSEPKAVQLTHENLSFAISSCLRFFITNENELYAGILPLFSLFAQIYVLNSALLQGACLNLYPKLNPEILHKAIFSDKVTFLAASPGVYRLLCQIKAIKKDRHALRYTLSFASPCDEDVVNKFEDLYGCAILEGYGTTETTSIISFNRTKEELRKNSVGVPFRGVEVKILNDTGEDVSPGEHGEIVVRGQNVMAGYVANPERAENEFNDSWFHTGDVGKLDEDGFLYFIDRKTDVIMKGGFYIYPAEIETLLQEHPKIHEISIIGMPHPKQGEEVKACIVLKKGEVATADEIIDFCKQQIPVYKCPQVVQFYKSLPKSSTGKILKRKLYEQS